MEHVYVKVGCYIEESPLTNYSQPWRIYSATGRGEISTSVPHSWKRDPQRPAIENVNSKILKDFTEKCIECITHICFLACFLANL